MCYKDEDERLWQEDPYEYIRMKFSKCVNVIVSSNISVICELMELTHSVDFAFCLLKLY